MRKQLINKTITPRIKKLNLKRAVRKGKKHNKHRLHSYRELTNKRRLTPRENLYRARKEKFTTKKIKTKTIKNKRKSIDIATPNKLFVKKKTQ